MKLAAYSLLALIALDDSTRGSEAVFVDLFDSLFPSDERRGPYSPYVQVGAISGDGSVIGGSIVYGFQAVDCANLACGQGVFQWSTGGTDLLELPPLPNERRPQWGNAPIGIGSYSRDGSVAAVTYDQNTGWYVSASALVEADRVTELLPEAPELDGWFQATGVSDDGSRVVGRLLQRDATGRPTERIAASWAADTGVVRLSNEASADALTPVGVSGDGSITILSPGILLSEGLLYFESPQGNSAQWSPADGYSVLQPADGLTQSVAAAISQDGSTIVGSSVGNAVPGYSRATAWINNQPTPLEAIFDSSSALDVSADGAMIVGSATFLSPETDAFFYPEAVLWRDGEPHILEDLLANEYALGAELEGWTLTSATAISDDGTVIAGQGIDPDGDRSAWVAILAVPEPSTALLGGWLLTLVIAAKRRPRNC